MDQVLVMVQATGRVMDLLCTCKAIHHNPILDPHITTNHLITLMDLDMDLDTDMDTPMDHLAPALVLVLVPVPACMKRKIGTTEEILMHPLRVLPEVILI